MDFVELRSGTSVAGDDIKAYYFQTKNNVDKYVYLMAGAHGDEVEGVYVLDKLFTWLKEEADINTPLVIVPILNVDGYRNGTRTNAGGVDLNRNFPSKSWSQEYQDEKYNSGPSPLSEPENKFLDKLFQKFPPKLIISFHSWKPMLNYNGECKEVAEYLHQFNHYEVCEEIEGHLCPGSLGDYAPEKYQCPVLTFECPLLKDELTLKDIWSENEEALKNLMQSEMLK
jgi:protein MpaA